MSNTSNEPNFLEQIAKFADNASDSLRGTADSISRDGPLDRPAKHNSDPYSSGNNNKFDLSNPAFSIESGVIGEAMPFWGWYKVDTFGASTSIMCSLLSDVSQMKMGARRIGSLQPHTKVYYIRNSFTGSGIILGAESEVMPDVADILAERISMASGHTVVSEATNTFLHALDPECLADFSRGSPLDSTLVGERGWVCETGTSIFIDPFMAFIKADENCGFWALYFDQVARMQGHNIQIRACGYELEVFDDNGEITAYSGRSPYAFEGLGATSQGVPTAKKISAQEEQIGKPYLGTTDTMNTDKDTQVPYHRFQAYTGYAGQGFREILRLPPENTGSVAKMGDPTGSIVWEQNLALDGNYHMRSSQGITIAHSPLYMPPNRLKRMEDNDTGDKIENYKFSGLNGGGNPHLLTDTPVDANSFVGRALCADDDTAYGFAWRNDHPFKYHEKDFKIEKPKPEKTPSYGELAGNWYIRPPTSEAKKVDHRYSADYNALMSYFKILPDGTIVIAGPNGEEIRMVGGSIEISCPGDIQLRPGRNLISLAGRSTCIRALEDIDVASSNADVRIKSEKDMFLLAGNSGIGGKLLIENKAPGSGGIVLKSAGNISALAEIDIYIRSGAGGKARNLILDAGGESPGDVIMTGRAVHSFLERSRFDYLGGSSATDGACRTVNIFAENATVMGSPLYSKGTIAGLGYMVCKKHLISTEGHIATLKGGFVGSLDNDVDGDGKTASEEANEQLEKINISIHDAQYTAYDIFESGMYKPFRGPQRLGDADPAGGWGKYAFYFKSTSEYKADAFVIYESRWQQRNRMFGGNAGAKWLENPVWYLDDDTYPYPGKGAWTNPVGLKEIDLKFYNDLVPEVKIEDKKNPGDEQSKPLDGFYSVIG